MGLAERNTWGSISILIGLAKSATPGEGLSEVILGVGVSVNKLFLYCNVYPLRLLKQVLEMGISICMIRN